MSNDAAKATTAAIDAVQSALAEFQGDCAQWDAEIEQLLGQIDTLSEPAEYPPSQANVDRLARMEHNLTELKLLVQEQKEALAPNP